MEETSIILVPFGEIEKNLLEKLRDELKFIFHPLPVTISKAIPVPLDAYNSSRGQYHSSYFLEALRKFADKCSKFLGITSLDLFTNGLNFIFGQAVIDGNVCVISTHRLRPEFYGLPFNEKILIERSVKEAVHELGHSFSLKHCFNPRCVMYFSNHVLDTDHKGKNFCENCLLILRKKIKLNSREVIN
ncbi:MAG: archaemetzincin family Zn-dependent metalloprotease [Candidatus Jordarchaeaceae archaeon]